MRNSSAELVWRVKFAPKVPRYVLSSGHDCARNFRGMWCSLCTMADRVSPERARCHRVFTQRARYRRSSSNGGATLCAFLISCASPIACPARGGIKRLLLRSCCGSECSLAYGSVRTIPYTIWCTTKCMPIIATKRTYAAPAGLKDAGLCINNPRGHTQCGPCLLVEDQVARGACGALPTIRCSMLLLPAFQNTVSSRCRAVVSGCSVPVLELDF